MWFAALALIAVGVGVYELWTRSGESEEAPPGSPPQPAPPALGYTPLTFDVAKNNSIGVPAGVVKKQAALQCNLNDNDFAATAAWIAHLVGPQPGTTLAQRMKLAMVLKPVYATWPPEARRALCYYQKTGEL